MRGRPWTEEAQALLEKRTPDAEIVRRTGITLRTVQEHRRAMGARVFPNRIGWSRRDWLLADAAGLDFQM